MDIVIIAFGFVIVLLGILWLSSESFVWEITERNNSREGVKSEKTSEWNDQRILTGIVILLAGIVLAALPFLIDV